MQDESETVSCELRYVRISLNGTNQFAQSPAAGPVRKASTASQSGSGNFPPPKTDKPRPHICATCSRSFARLEHLKRHERSHTKEKPFECPECTRCFARRDLLLRHQQKLHMTTTPSSRPRAGRRESTSTAGGRARKNSLASTASTVAAGGTSAATMRPRANTISHVDKATLGAIGALNGSLSRNAAHATIGHSQHPSLSALPGVAGYEYRGMSNVLGHHGMNHLPKLETHVNPDFGGGLRTAPPFQGFSNDFGADGSLFGGGPTINPAQLQVNGSPEHFSIEAEGSPYAQAFQGMSATQPILQEELNFDWVNGFESQMSFNPNSEQAIDESSPSAMSTASQSGVSEMMLDSSQAMQNSTPSFWQHTSMAPTLGMNPSPFAVDFTGAHFPDMVSQAETVSPKSLQAQSNVHAEANFASPPPLTDFNSIMPNLSNTYFHPPMAVHNTPSTSSGSVRSSDRQSSVTSVSTDSITDVTRHALLTSLSQPSIYGRKYSQPVISSPLSPAFASRARSYSAASVSLPSTADLQRYISAYIRYFHPHLPFLHIPSLTFDSPAYTSNLRSTSGHAGYGPTGIAGGGGCLILAMAAIGALYEFERPTSKDLFESAKKMIQLYLEERRKADMSAALNGTNGGNDSSVHNTPLWLVQAMLLNVIYGHNCGDKTSGDIASTHCAALVSLARAAELARPLSPESLPKAYAANSFGNKSINEDVEMNGTGGQSWNSRNQQDNDDQEWLNWKLVEERKRTLYTVFILSSLLVSAYNHAPALTNSEIRLDLPCDEDLWAAESSQAWRAKGGAAVAEQGSVTFATALSSLLTASQREQSQQHNMPQTYLEPFGSGVNPSDLPRSELQLSTFGCLVLINALHNYIWETRQRHLGRQWTSQETEAMHAHIEPALRAWQSAWASNPLHSLERPNPFGMGPLSADSIPLLDLAYVRLFVNLGRSKEAFWQRDYDAMAEELAKGSEIVQHADYTPSSTASDQIDFSSLETYQSPDVSILRTPTQEQPIPDVNHVARSGQSSKRERHLRKAAFYAADSLSMSDKLGVTFAEFTSRELPIQSAMCAFDCAQVLAEWVTTVQERVGRYLGILGTGDVDYGQVPGIMLLEDEDCKLLEKIAEVLESAESKLAMPYDFGGIASMPASVSGSNGVSTGNDSGYGSKILRVTAHMLEKAAVWPGEFNDV